MIDEGERTGEMGFCAACGAPVAVVVVRHERLDGRVFRAAQAGKPAKRWQATQFLARSIARLIMAVATAADLVSFGIPDPLLLHLRSAADEAAYRLATAGSEGEWPHYFLTEAAKVQLGEALVSAQIELYCASGALEVIASGERWDLGKRAAQKMERE